MGVRAFIEGTLGVALLYQGHGGWQYGGQFGHRRVALAIGIVHLAYLQSVHRLFEDARVLPCSCTERRECGGERRRASPLSLGFERQHERFELSRLHAARAARQGSGHGWGRLR